MLQKRVRKAKSEGKQRYNDKATAVKAIEANGGKVGSNGNITMNQPGIRMLGCIDFLVNRHGCRWIREIKAG